MGYTGGGWEPKDQQELCAWKLKQLGMREPERKRAKAGGEASCTAEQASSTVSSLLSKSGRPGQGANTSQSRGINLEGVPYIKTQQVWCL